MLLLIKIAFIPKFFSRIKLKDDVPNSSWALCNYNDDDDDDGQNTVLMCARHFSEQSTFLNSFNPGKKPKKVSTIITHTHRRGS